MPTGILMTYSKISVFLLSLVFCGFYVAGLINPELWWGTHSLGFLPGFLKYTVLFLGFVFLLFSLFYKRFPIELNKSSIFQRPYFSWLTALLISGILFQFPMVYDLYGDSAQFMETFEAESNLSVQEHVSIMMSADITQPKIGERTILNAVWLLQQSAGLDVRSSFRWMEILFCFILLGSFFHFIRIHIPNWKWQVILGVILFTTPVLQLFLGHIEIYFAVITAIAIYLMSLLSYFRTKRKLYLWALIPLWLLCMKFHITSLLLIPSLVLVFVYHFTGMSEILKKFFTWKSIGIGVLLPIALIGVYVYFVILKDQYDPRWLADDLPVIERVFLPIFSPEAPFDRYNLLSFNHIFDYFNQMLLWSSGALFIISAIVLFFRKHIQWNHPELVITGLTLILYTSFFFMFNPLLSMPMDWDLFAIPAPVMILFTVALCSQLTVQKIPGLLLGTVVALGLFGMSGIWVNNQFHALSKKAEHTGVHIYKTYWSHSADVLYDGLGMVPYNDEEHFNRYLSIIDRIQPYANTGNDLIFSQFTDKIGDYLHAKSYYRQAVHFLELSRDYYESNTNYMIPLMESYMALEQFENAYSTSLLFIKYRHPDPVRALRIAVHSALEAEKYQEAIHHSESYLIQVPDDMVMQDIQTRLLNNERVGELKDYFKSR